MACTPTSRPTGRYYASLVLYIALLALLTSLILYIAETRSQLCSLVYTVNTHDARIAAIPEFVYEIDKEINTLAPAAGETSVPPAAKQETNVSVYQDVIMRTCVARNYSDKSTVVVSSSLARLVGRELYIPEIQYRVTVISIERELDFAPAVRICSDARSSRLLDNKRVTIHVVK